MEQHVHLGDRFSRRRRIAITLVLGLLTGVGPFTIDMYLPSFPALKQDLSITDAQVQITLSATTFGFAMGQLLIGPLSDRVGRRRPLLAMSSLHVLASIMVAISPNVEFLTVMRALQGIGAAGGAVVALAMARDLFSGRRLMRMMARLSLISGLAPIVAPILGSWLVSVVNWRGIFWVLATYGLTVLTLVSLLIVETRPPSERTSAGIGPLLAAYRRVFGDRTFVGVWLVAAFAFGGLFSYVSTSSVLLQQVYGLSAQGFGVVFAICSVGVFTGVQLGSRLAARIGPARILAVATSVMVLAASALLLLNATVPGVLPLVPAIFCFTTGFGACMPTSQVLALQRHRADSGVAASLIGAGNMLTGAVVGPIIGSFALHDAAPMGIAMLSCALVSTAALWLIVRPLRVQVQFD